MGDKFLDFLQKKDSAGLLVLHSICPEEQFGLFFLKKLIMFFFQL